MRRNIKNQLFFSGVAVIILLSFTVLFATGCARKEENKAKHFDKAQEYIARNELKKAVIELKQVVQLDPKDDAAYEQLGEIYLKLKENGEAFQAYTRAVSVNPENIVAQLKLGQMLLLMGKTDEARKKADMILEKVPDHLEALELLAGVQVQEKDFEGGIKTLEKAASVNPTHFNTQLSLGRLLLLQGKPDKAEEHYQKAIALDPSSSVPYVELSRIYAGRGEWNKAEAVLKRMIMTSDSTYHALDVLASFYESTQQFALAEQTYVRAVEAAPQGDVAPLIQLAAYYGRIRSYDRALQAMQKVAEIRKDDLDVLVSIAQLHFYFNKVQEAEATVDKVLEKDNGHLDANLLKGRILLARKDFRHALERFDLVVRNSPRNGLAYYFRGLCRIEKGDPKMGQQDLLKALRFNPGLLDARLLLAGFYLKDRNADLARQQIDAAAKISPYNPRVLMNAGSLKVLEGDLKGAEEIYSRIIRADADYAPAYTQLGLIYNLTNRQPEALKFFNKALALSPNQTDALSLIVRLYVRDKKYDEALKACEDLKKKYTPSRASLAHIEYMEGRILLAKKDYEPAENRFKTAVEKEPDNLAAYEALAEIYAKEKRFDEAIREYERVIAKNPKYLAGYMALGAIYDKKGDGQSAEAYYRKALNINKNFGPAANNLAWNLAERGGNIDEALTFAQIAKEQLPDSSAVMDTLGYIYYLKGSYLNAVMEFQDSLSRDPENPVINFHMGLAQYKNNDKAKAKDYFEKALELDPNFKEADEARRLLEEITAL
jgi:tetratricopeptide (TPR) repeat protein